MRTEIATLGEFGLIRHLTEGIELKNKSSQYGVGDDAAVLSYPADKEVLVTTDLLLEGIHFDLTYVPLKHLGYKSAVVNFSDIYAMNGTPRQITVSLGLSKRFSVEEMEELYAGIRLACEEYGASFFGNGASPSGVLEHPGVIKNPERVRDAWQRAYGGRNAHKVAVLEEGMKFTPIAIPNNEAQFLETRKFQIEEIARMYRVPLHMIGDLDHATFSNVEHLSLDFVKYSLDPWIVRWEQSLQKALLSDSEKGQYFVKFNVDGLLRGDYASRMQGYAIARQNGWMSANDIRELEDMNMLSEEEGGNLYLVNGSFTKLADAGAFANQNSEKEEKTK